MIGHVLNSMNEVITNEYTTEHQAIDIVSSDHTETDIINLETGIVEEAVKDIPSTDHNSKGLATYGNYVKIRQNDGKSALYAHMKYGSVNVNEGDYVEKGAVIGTMGSTGNAYGKHLHLEIKDENGIHENPIIELNKVETTIEETTKEEIVQPENSEPQKENSTPQKENKEKVYYLQNKTYKDGSIVDGLKEIGSDSSYDYREKLAEKNGIENYHGSYDQNVYMLKLLKEGKLKA